MQDSAVVRNVIYGASYCAAWTASFFYLRQQPGFATGEALAALLILGLVFPTLAWLSTLRISPLSVGVQRPREESICLVNYLFLLAAIVAFGFGVIARIQAEPLHTVVLAAVKLVSFVLIPAALVMKFGRYRWNELAPISSQPRSWQPALWMSAAALLMEAILGGGVQQIRNAHFSSWQLAIAAPLCFIWLAVEAGVVEEFFFRVLLQERLSVLLRSRWGGLIISAALFGLMHAPGLYLRPAATQENLGPHPTLGAAIAYSILMTSLAGLFLGVPWMRTRNFLVVVLVHGATDLLPNLVPWVKDFHLAR